MHAVNAMLGRRAYSSWAAFSEVCDAFDASAGLPAGTSRGLYIGADRPGNSLFALALQRAGWPTARAVVLEMHADKAHDVAAAAGNPSVQGFFVYDVNHVWVVRRSGRDAWVKVDSLHGVSAVRNVVSELNRRDVGVEVITVAPPAAEPQRVAVPLPPLSSPFRGAYVRAPPPVTVSPMPAHRPIPIPHYARPPYSMQHCYAHKRGAAPPPSMRPW